MQARFKAKQKFIILNINFFNKFLELLEEILINDFFSKEKIIKN